MPDDEAFEYLPTQATVEYFATECNEPLDGITFHSVQAKGETLNITLFHKASLAEEISIPAGTEIYAHTSTYEDEGRKEIME